MATQNYRPAIGETLFMILYDNDPVVITVTGYHDDDRFSSEQIDYTQNGKVKSSSLNQMKFYPDTNTDLKFFYTVVAEESEFMAPAETTRLEVFFNPDDAFQYLEEVETGDIEPNYVTRSEFASYSVIVEKVP